VSLMLPCGLGTQPIWWARRVHARTAGVECRQPDKDCCSQGATFHSMPFCIEKIAHVPHVLGPMWRWFCKSAGPRWL
jgi:hypothetical protein